MEGKIENEIFSVYWEKQTYANELKSKRRNLGTESCVTASDESGNWEESLSIPKNYKKQ